ncbi:hypothetical protein Cni_G15979 [Canna indica]|uniref:RING-type domain-containing protein n=1 Tax=Canna indica TaxID=4628 RepID=A0AAQ3KEQ0_9LILI|nr:hypothetical protein Cni_G15979 [Canna indica]
MPRFLTTNSEQLPSALPPTPSGLHFDTDVVVIIASLLCAMVSIAGLALVARCTCPRRRLGRGNHPQRPPDKGLEKKALRQLPKISYRGSEGPPAECPICLAEFEEGDQLRVLPQCGHGFHAGCVDAWLASHSSCPSCRRVLVVAAPPSRCGVDSVDAAEPAEAGAGGHPPSIP